MSNSKLVVEKIKGLMAEFGFSTEKELMSFSIEDDNNTILQVEKLAVGQKAIKINEEFNQVSLEDGSYKLKENFEIEVLNGKIMKVKEIFVDAKLSDGTAVKVEGDMLSEGAKVVVVTEQGEIPAPDGVHEISDGTKIETKDGVIVRIEEVVAAGRMIDKPEKMEDVEVPVEVPAEVAPVAQDVVQAIVEAIVPLMEEVKSITEEMKRMKSQFEAFKKQPAAAPIKNGKTEFNKVSKTDDLLDARVSAILGSRNK